MSYIVIDEVYENCPFQQEWEVQQFLRFHLHSVRLDLYKHKDPAGSLTLRVKDGAEVLAEKKLTSAEINAGAGLNTDEYFHGFVLFQLDYPIILNKKKYIFELEGTDGYTFSEDNYFGWKKEYENFTNTITDEPSIEDFLHNPFTFQVWELKRN